MLESIFDAFVEISVSFDEMSDVLESIFDAFVEISVSFDEMSDVLESIFDAFVETCHSTRCSTDLQRCPYHSLRCQKC